MVTVDFAREDRAADEEANLDADDRENEDAKGQVEVGHFFALMVGVDEINVRGHVHVVEEASEDTFEDETGERQTFTTFGVLLSGH